MSKFESGDKVKVKFGLPIVKDSKTVQRYRRGLFVEYSVTGKYARFVHINSGRILKRPVGDFLTDDQS